MFVVLFIFVTLKHRYFFFDFFRKRSVKIKYNKDRKVFKEKVKFTFNLYHLTLDHLTVSNNCSPLPRSCSPSLQRVACWAIDWSSRIPDLSLL